MYFVCAATTCVYYPAALVEFYEKCKLEVYLPRIDLIQYVHIEEVHMICMHVKFHLHPHFPKDISL